MNWVIQKDVLSEEQLTMKMAQKKGHSVFEFEYIPFEDPYEILPKQEEKSMFRGSLEFAEKVENRDDLIVYGNRPEYTYTNFYDQWKDVLLNKEIWTIEVENLSSKIFRDNRIVFVRPDKGDKAFTGQCFEYGTLWEPCKTFIERNTNPNDILVVSTKKPIGKEYRFVCFQNEVLAGSMYSTEDSIEYKQTNPDNPIWSFVQEEVKKRTPPADFWVVDACELGDEYRIIELNSFSCASWYKANRKPIVEMVESYDFNS